MLLLYSSVVVAEESSEAYQEMLRLSAQGNQLYEAGQLEEAAATFERAFDAYPQPILLKNQMVAFYLLEDCKRALPLGESFLAAGQASEEDIDDVHAVFGECALELAEAALAEEDYESLQRWLRFGGPYFDEDHLREDAEELTNRLEEHKAAEQRDTAVVIAPVEVESDLDVRQIAGWSLVTVGAGTLVMAAIWNVQAVNQFGELELLSRSDPRFEELSNSIDRARIAVPVLYGVGGVAAVAGVVLLVLPNNEVGDRARVTPVVHPEYLGFTLQHRF